LDIKKSCRLRIGEVAFKLMAYFGDYQKLSVFDGDDSPCIPNNPLKTL